MDDSKKTIGQISLELSQKEPDTKDPIELQREMQKDYMENLILAVDTFKTGTQDNFFVEVITKKEKLMQNVLRNYFIARHSCPTPAHDQSVFMYNADDESIEYLWTVPDKETTETLYENAPIVEEKELLNCVIAFKNGELYNWMRKLNNEVENKHLILVEEA